MTDAPETTPSFAQQVAMNPVREQCARCATCHHPIVATSARALQAAVQDHRAFSQAVRDRRIEVPA